MKSFPLFDSIARSAYLCSTCRESGEMICGDFDSRRAVRVRTVDPQSRWRFNKSQPGGGRRHSAASPDEIEVVPPSMASGLSDVGQPLRFLSYAENGTSLPVKSSQFLDAREEQSITPFALLGRAQAPIAIRGSYGIAIGTTRQELFVSSNWETASRHGRCK